MSPQTSISEYLVKLKKRFLVAERTIALQFEKPPGFTFRPGQWIDITLLNPSETDEEGDTRGFSIASAPHEDFLMVVTRLRDTAYKRQLPDLPLDTVVKLEGPGGELRLQNRTEHAAVFLAGGIGITPVRSILLHAAHENLQHQIFVFYSNRRPEDTAFLEELTDLQRENPNFTVIPTMTGMAKSTQSWNGETARMNEALLAKYLTEVQSPIYYVVGPPDMVSGVHETLNKAGVDDDDIRTEEFEGYGAAKTPKYLVKLKKRFFVAERTMAFQFERPPGFSFRPGQWIDLTLLNPSETDAEGNTRRFSVASAPDDDSLMVVTRVRDTAFKRQLSHLPLNTEVKLEGPGGAMRLHNRTEHAAVFLVGGIGITPVHSILLQVAHDTLAHHIFVFFSNRRPEDAAFLDELTELQQKIPNFTLIPTMTGMAKSTQSWDGETARLDETLLRKYLADAKSPIYYLVGPSKMVNAVHEMLNKAGIDDDDIRRDEFEGY
ncbi:MAG: FAD-dependent oxidoreductase [Desulfobulbus sp.]|jgi:ferredoxin-NADP reductase|nr:FAD-dependent oxidoreductase [Desulfobulbus sp.]